MESNHIYASAFRRPKEKGHRPRMAFEEENREQKIKVFSAVSKSENRLEKGLIALNRCKNTQPTELQKDVSEVKARDTS